MITRRRLLATAGGLAAAGYLTGQSSVLAAPRTETELGKVKIVDVKTASISIRYPAH